MKVMRAMSQNNLRVTKYLHLIVPDELKPFLFQRDDFGRGISSFDKNRHLKSLQKPQFVNAFEDMHLLLQCPTTVKSKATIIPEY